jgi:hypothetical protein
MIIVIVRVTKHYFTCCFVCLFVHVFICFEIDAVEKKNSVLYIMLYI